jgi:cytochrome c
MKDRIRFGLVGVLICAGGFVTESRAQWTYDGCPAVTNADFKVDTLMRKGLAPDPSLAEPDKLAFDMDAQGNVDVWFTEIRPGNIKRYSAKTKTVKVLAKLPNWGGPGSDYLTVKNSNNVEEGVTGIALDPNFKTNHFVYIHWSPLPATTAVFRISRFTYDPTADNIPLNSEKILMEFPAQRDECCHTGGSMEFDAYGDLWIAQGANGGRTGSSTSTPMIGMSEDKKYDSEEWGATSTHGYRGGFLRIHPVADAQPNGKYYTIPAGNFGEHFAKTTGDNKYLDTSKVYPEIYIKGTRNNYSMALHPVRRWVAWGDVGPDDIAGATREEVNVRRSPGFEGWPYFVGANTVYTGKGKDVNAPSNTSKWNTGLTVLPPARPATKLHTLGTSPISGPIYLYDGALSSTVKFPPHFNYKWFITDYTSSVVNVLTLDTATLAVTKAERIFANMTFNGPVDFRQGPDGAFYIVNYGPANFASGTNTTIMKISYTGTCRPALPVLERPSVGIMQPGRAAPVPGGMFVNLGAGRSVLVPTGMAGMEIYDFAGRKVWSSGAIKAGENLKLPMDLQRGALKYRWVPGSL